MSVGELVSVVIPSFNHRKYVGQAVQSVLDQSYENLECVIIDDGSSDGSYEFIADTFGSDPRLKLRHRENRGADATINEGVGLAQGHFISILNSDDYYEPERLKILVDAAAETTRPFFGITGVRIVDISGREVETHDPAQYYYDTVSNSSANLPDVFGLWAGNIAMTTSNFFFSCEVYQEVGPFKPLRYAHDWDWALRASSRFNLYRTPEKLVNYRRHGANTIDEPDHWRHVVEDAYVWASMLRGDKAALHAINVKPETFFGSVLKNIGFPIIPIVYILSDPRSDRQLLDDIGCGKLQQEIETVFQKERLDIAFAESLPGTLNTISGLRNVKDSLSADVFRLQTELSQQNNNILRFQAALAQERDDALNLQNRAAELTSIKQSLSWKLFSWLWRLETRGERRAKRKARLRADSDRIVP